MVDTSVTYQLVSIPEAARILTISQSSVRRLVKAGKLEAERVERPQGYVWLVKVPAPSTDAPGNPPRWVPASPTNPPDEPPSDALAVLVQATVREAITPLVELVERQAEMIRTQAEQIGALTARLEAATRPESPPAAPGSTEGAGTAPESPQRGFRHLWPLFGVVVLLVVLVVAVAVVWGR